MRQLYLSFFISLYLLITSQITIAQENQLESIIKNASDFMSNVVIRSDNVDCVTHFMGVFLDERHIAGELWPVISESFRMTVDADIMDLQQDPLNLLRKIMQVPRENLQRHAQWLENRAQNTTQEEIDEMRKDLDDMEWVWDYCLEYTQDNIILNQ